MKLPSIRRRLSLAGIAVAVAVAGAAIYFAAPGKISQATGPASKAEQATPAAVAAVVERNVAIWDEFSGRLEAVERVDVRSRVAGAVQAVHFREGALVKQGDLLITIDPAPYAAEVERSEAQVVAAQARVALTKSELERGRQLCRTSAPFRNASSISASTRTARPRPTCGLRRRRCRPTG